MDIGSLQIIVFIATFLLMLAVGITSSYEDLKNNIFIIDRALVVSIILQLLIVPIIFFIFVDYIFDLETHVKIFFIILATRSSAITSSFILLLLFKVTLSVLLLRFWSYLFTAFADSFLFGFPYSFLDYSLYISGVTDFLIFF